MKKEPPTISLFKIPYISESDILGSMKKVPMSGYRSFIAGPGKLIPSLEIHELWDRKYADISGWRPIWFDVAVVVPHLSWYSFPLDPALAGSWHAPPG